MFAKATKTNSTAKAKPKAEPAAAEKKSQQTNPIWQALATGGLIQTKLAVSASDDPQEREADRVADQIVIGATPVSIPKSSGEAQIQRQTPAATGQSQEPPNLLKIYSFGPTGAGRVERASGMTVFPPPAPVDASGRELVQSGSATQPILSRFGRYFTVDERDRPQIPPSISEVVAENVWTADDGSQNWITNLRVPCTYSAPGEPLGSTLGDEYILRNDRPGVFEITYVLLNSVSRFIGLNHEVHYVNDRPAPNGATVLDGQPGPPAPPPPTDNRGRPSTNERTNSPPVQRKCAGCEEEEDQKLQRSENGAASPAVAPQVVSPGLNSAGQPLDPDTRAFMEQRLNHDFGDVRVHTGPAAGNSARAINALAFTLHRDVVFAPGQYRPTTNAGRRLLAHELTHVVQQSSSHVPEIQRVIEVRPPGRGEATAFGRRQELIDRMNQVSTGTRFRLDGQVLALDEIPGGAQTNFEQQIRRLMGLAEIVPMRLITSAGRAGGAPVTVDDFPSAYVDLDDLLASDDLSFQLNLIHLLIERSRVRNYARRIGTASLGRDPATGLPPAEFTRAHNAGLGAEAELLQNVIGDPTIRFNFEEPKPNGTIVFAFRSDEGYRVFHVFRGAGRAEQHGEIFVQTRDGRRLTIVQLIAERAAAAAAAAPPAVAPPAAAPPAAAPPVQPKLAVSQPNDPYELEADRVADQVMRSASPTAKDGAPPVAFQIGDQEGRQELQLKEAGRTNLTYAPESVDEALASPGRPLDSATQSFMEDRFGQSFDSVRVHDNSLAAESASSMAARAFTAGADIFFASGEYSPETNAGRRLLAHELTHVVQQAGQAPSAGAPGEPPSHISDSRKETATRRDRQSIAGDSVVVSEQPAAVISRDACEGENVPLVCDPASRFSPSQRTFLSNVGVNPQSLTWQQAGRLAADLTQFQNIMRAIESGATPTNTAGAAGSIFVQRTNCAEEVTYTIPGRIDIYWRIDLSSSSQTYEFRYHDPVFAARGVHQMQRVAPAEGGTLSGCAPPTPAQNRTPLPPVVPHVAPPAPAPAPSIPEAEDNTRLNNVLQHLQEGRWDVDSLTAELSDRELGRLSVADRIGLVRHISGGYIVGDEDEQTIIRLLATTPNSDAAAVLAAMDSSLLSQLESAIDFAEYRQYHTTLHELFFRARTPEETLTQMEEARRHAFPWANPGLIHAMWNRRFHYDDIEFTSEGKLRISYWIAVGPLALPTTAVEVDPFQMIAVVFFYPEDYMGAQEGQVIYMPAINLRSLYRKQFRQEMQTVADVAMLAAGGAGLVGAATRLGRAIAALELALGAADVAIRDFRPQIATTAAGRNFLDKWETVQTLIAIYSVTRVAITLPRLFRALREAYGGWRAVRGAEISGEGLQQIDNQVQSVLNNADEAEQAAAQSGNAARPGAAQPGATGAPATPEPAAQAPPAQAPPTEAPPAQAPPAQAPPAQAPPTQAPPTQAPPTQAPPAPAAAAPEPNVVPRVDTRAVGTVIAARSGVQVAVTSTQLEHVLRAHTVENFDPVRRVAELAGEAPTHVTDFFRPGSITNPQELFTLIRQALEGAAGRLVRATGQTQLNLVLRGERVVVWVGGAGAGAGVRINSIYPIRSGRGLTLAQIRAFADEITNGLKTLQQVRNEVAAMFR